MHAAFGMGSSQDGVVVDHLDVIPSSLLARLSGSLASSTSIVHAAHDRVVGLLAAADGDVGDRIARALLARLGRGLVLARGTDAGVDLPVGELALVEAHVHGVRVSAYLALEAFAPEGPAPVAALASLPVVVDVVMGRTALDVGSLRALEPGDVVLVDEDYRPLLHLARAGLALPHRFALREGAFTFISAEQVPERTMPPTDDTRAKLSPADDSLVPIASLPVELSIELARVETSVGELAALVPGAVLATSRAPSGQVVLRAHGAAIARGELVEIDGELGVRITEVSARG